MTLGSYLFGFADFKAGDSPMKCWLISLLILLILHPYGIMSQSVPGDAGISGKIVNRLDQKVDLAHVILDPPGSLAISDTSGLFHFKGLSPGYYRLRISCIGYQSQELDSILVSENQVSEVIVVLVSAMVDAAAIVVTASRKPQAVVLAPSAVTVVSAERIESQNLQTFDQAFNNVAGLQVTRSSGGNIQALSIRGASEVAGGGIGNRVLLILDGRPILSPESGGALWNLVPLQSIDRIEVVKGPYSSLFGSSAMGGVINVITRVPREKFKMKANVNTGFYSRPPANAEYNVRGRYYAADIGLSGGSSRWKYVLDGGRRQNQGHREKSSFSINHLFGKLINEPNQRDRWILSANYNYIENDAPATWFNSRLAYQVADHRKDDFQQKEEFSFDLNHKALKSGRLKYDSRMYYYHNYAYYSFNDNPEDSTRSNVNFGKQSVDEEFIYTHRIGSSFQVDYKQDNHYLVGGTDAKFDYVNGIPDTVLYGEHAASSFGVFVQDEIEWSADLITTVGLRYDLFYLKNAISESNFSPRIATTYQIGDRLLLRGLFSQAFRNPSIAERFIKFEQGGGLRFVTNPTLRSEKLVAAVELGGTYQWNKNTSASLAIFYNRYSGLISFQQVPNPQRLLIYKVVNLNKAVMRGTEFEFAYRMPNRYSATLNYTFLDAQDRSENRQNDYLAYKIKHSLNASLGYTVRNIELLLQTRYRSGIKEVFIYPGSEPGPYWLWNAKITMKVRENLQAYLAIDNISNTLYEELERYRMPGRHSTLGFRWGL